MQDYKSLYSNDILNPDNFVELYCHLLTNEYSNNVQSSNQINTMMKPSFLTLINYVLNTSTESERRNSIMTIENYLLNNNFSSSYIWPNTLSEILINEQNFNKGY